MKNEWESDYCETQHNHIIDGDDDDLIVCCRCFCAKAGDIPCPDGHRYREKEADERDAKAHEDDGPCERCGCDWCEADDEQGDHQLFVSHKDGKNVCRDCVWKEDEEEE